MVRIWRFSRQKRCFKSDTRMTKSVTPTARPELQGLQRAVDVLIENIGRLGSDLAQGFQHLGRPELAHVCADLTGDILPGRDAARDLIRPLDQVLLLVVTRGAHTRCSELGRISTAVTLYSGQLVAQSELSVVITLVPLTGW